MRFGSEAQPAIPAAAGLQDGITARAEASTRRPSCHTPGWVVLAALVTVGVCSPAWAEAPKLPEAKVPELKAPELKAPELKAPEAKLPEVKLPETQSQEPKAAGKKGEAPKKVPEARVSESESYGIPPQLAGEDAGPTRVEVTEVDDSKALTIEELANSRVLTASNRPESSLDAPAWIITLTAEDLKNRGYQELTDMLDDLPGMDVIRGWGDTYFKNYWRGYRNNIGDPFLLMVDGVPFNHLWLGEAQIMAALPLSNIEQVEVVYGPASALYGPNASMGVINVITRKDHAQRLGTGIQAQMSLRSPQGSLGRMGEMTKVGDLSALYKGQGFRVSVTGRFDFGVLDPALKERFEWLKDTYSTDAGLWGQFLDYPSLAGSFRSPSEKQALDARLIVERRDDEGHVTGETEVAAQVFRMVTGSGLIYPTDLYQSRSLWTVLEQSMSLRHRQDLSTALRSTTLLRYRRSNVDNPTTVLGRNRATGDVSFQYRMSTNSSVTVAQGFSLFAGSGLVVKDDELMLDFGLQYERRDLDKDALTSGTQWDPEDPFFDANGRPLYTFPSPIEAGANLQNRHELDVLGAYLLGKYKVFNDHFLHLGLRFDYNGAFDKLVPTFRGGYVGQFLADSLIVKLFYGQAVEEPGWQYLSDSLDGPDTTVQGDPERSQTLEVGVDYRLSWLMLHGTVYLVRFDGTIAQDLEGQRRMLGADLGATAILRPPGVRQLRVWGYYSPYFQVKQTTLTDEGVSLVDTGDLARHKLLLGATLDVNRSLGVTALGRCVSERVPVSTNPLGPVPGYCTLDANLSVRDAFAEGLSLGVRVTNLLDTQFSHPGLYDADSGNTPGRWEGSEWIGSSGYSNSQMPQPGRAFTVHLGLDL
ncbi:TonB-dependent receptor [Myxococcaceae bacterium GXIMD 01537]